MLKRYGGELFHEFDFNITFNNIESICTETFESICVFTPENQDDYITEETKQIFQKAGLEFKRLFVFSYPPGKTGPIHIDGDITDEWRPSFNVVLTEESKGFIEYFDINTSDEIITETRKVTEHTDRYEKYQPTNRTVTLFEDHQCERIATIECSTKPTLIRTDIPHRIINNTDKWRHIVIMRFTNTSYLDVKEKLLSVK